MWIGEELIFSTFNWFAKVVLTGEAEEKSLSASKEWFSDLCARCVAVKLLTVVQCGVTMIPVEEFNLEKTQVAFQK